MIDCFVARLAIWALRKLFGVCEPPYDETCLGCVAARAIKACQDVLDDKI